MGWHGVGTVVTLCWVAVQDPTALPLDVDERCICSVVSLIHARKDVGAAWYSRHRKNGW